MNDQHTNDHRAVTLWQAWSSVDGRTVRTDAAYGDLDLDVSTFARTYEPAVTVTACEDLNDAYAALQGETVNAEQHARNMVPSASAGDVFEVHHTDGSRSFHLVAPIGFEELHL